MPGRLAMAAAAAGLALWRAPGPVSPSEKPICCGSFPGTGAVQVLASRAVAQFEMKMRS